MACSKPVVLILGPSGTGKTTFTNLVANEKLFQEGTGLDATTMVAQSVEILLDGRAIEVFDTPGPDAGERGEAKAHLIQLLHSLKQRNVVGMVYMHDISENRISKRIVESYKWLMDACGNDAKRNIVIVTNMWNAASGTDCAGRFDARERELRYGEPCYKTALANGALLQRHNNTRESALAILRLVLDHAYQDDEDLQSINSEKTCVDTRYDHWQSAQRGLDGRHSGGCFGLLRKHKHHEKSKGGSGEKH